MGLATHLSLDRLDNPRRAGSAATSLARRAPAGEHFGAFVDRPVATTLLTLGITLAWFFAYLKLPVAPRPQVDYRTILLFATMPGTSPETMASCRLHPRRGPHL